MEDYTYEHDGDRYEVSFERTAIGVVRRTSINGIHAEHLTALVEPEDETPNYRPR